MDRNKYYGGVSPTLTPLEEVGGGMKGKWSVGGEDLYTSCDDRVIDVKGTGSYSVSRIAVFCMA